MHIALINPSVTSPFVNYLISAGANLFYVSQKEKYNLLMIYLKNSNNHDVEIIRSLA